MHLLNMVVWMGLHTKHQDFHVFFLGGNAAIIALPLTSLVYACKKYEIPGHLLM